MSFLQIRKHSFCSSLDPNTKVKVWTTAVLQQQVEIWEWIKSEALMLKDGSCEPEAGT